MILLDFLRKKIMSKKVATKKSSNNSKLSIKVKLLNPEFIGVPTKATEGSSAYDLKANIKENLVLIPRGEAKIPTGVAFEIPQGYSGKVLCRSNIGNQGLIIPNAPGLIDTDYRGEIFVKFINIGKNIVTIEPGNRIAQIKFEKDEDTSLEEVSELSPTERGENGFGSTGV